MISMLSQIKNHDEYFVFYMLSFDEDNYNALSF